MATVPTVSIGEAEWPAVWRWRALRCGNLFAIQQRPKGIPGKRESGRDLCEPGLLSQGLSALNSVLRFPHWGVGDGRESLGNLPKCSERCRDFDLPLGIGSQGSIWLLRHTDEPISK